MSDKAAEKQKTEVPVHVVWAPTQKYLELFGAAATLREAREWNKSFAERQSARALEILGDEDHLLKEEELERKLAEQEQRVEELLHKFECEVQEEEEEPLPIGVFELGLVFGCGIIIGICLHAGVVTRWWCSPQSL